MINRSLKDTLITLAFVFDMINRSLKDTLITLAFVFDMINRSLKDTLITLAFVFYIITSVDLTLCTWCRIGLEGFKYALFYKLIIKFIID